jgi:prophage antirepressor-like protein
MDILKAFKLGNKEVQINIRGSDEDPLFQANQIGELLELTNIRVTLKDFDEDEKVVIATYTRGGNQQITFITEIGLYRLLGMSRKPIARTFQKWVCQVIKEIRKNGKYELQATVELERTLAKKNIEKERHFTIINAFKNKRILYFTKLQQHDEKYVIKLGYSNNIEARQRALVTSFGDSTFLNVFECNQNCEFELMLKRHPDFVKYRYKEVVFDDHKSSETYLLTMDEYHNLQKIVKRNAQNYQGFNAQQFITKKKLEVQLSLIDNQRELIELVKIHPDSIELQQSLLHTTMKIYSVCDDEGDKSSTNSTTLHGEDKTYSESNRNNVITTQNQHHESNLIIEHHEALPKIGEGNNIPRANNKNRKVQKYHPISFDLIETYEGLMDVIRKNETYSKIGVKDAALKDTIYNGFRWYFLQPNQEVKKYDIPPTRQIHSSIPRHIAMLNKDKNIIERVFISLQDAATAINSKRNTTISDAIKKESIVRGLYRFQYFENCDEQLKNAFLSKFALPALRIPKGTRVNQIDIISKLVINTYNSIAEVLKRNTISRESLKRACETGESHNEYLWEYA